MKFETCDFDHIKISEMVDRMRDRNDVSSTEEISSLLNSKISKALPVF